jgi:hypothetical protein
LAYGRLHVEIAGSGCTGPGNQHTIPTRLYVAQMEANGFAQQTLGAVARDGRSNVTTSRKGEP